MVDLNGHEAGNGGHSQGKPTAYRDLLYSERWGFYANDLALAPSDSPSYPYVALHYCPRSGACSIGQGRENTSDLREIKNARD
jgi:hypothetical protein